MLQDPYAVLRALMRAEAVRNAPKPPQPTPTKDTPDTRRPKQPPVTKELEHG
jgi:hypothetical protein